MEKSAGGTGDVGSIPGSGRSSGEGNGNPLQHSCLENAVERGAGRATVHGVTKEFDMTEYAHTPTHTHTHTHWKLRNTALGFDESFPVVERSP